MVALDIRATDAEKQVILVKPDGTIDRGPVGSTRVGHFDVRTVAGAEDPLACDARALSILPRLAKYPGPPESEIFYELPSELVR
jgi:hypothetical protein